MKILYTTLIFLATALTVNAQNATPNPGFENWTQVGNRVDPDNWNTLNPTTAILATVTCTRASGADAHSGNYAIKLTTKSVFGVTANGIASTGTLITTPPYGVSGGIPFTGRPDSISGWYKYTPQNADQGFIELLLTGTSITDTIGFVKVETPNATVSSFTYFSAPVTYYSSANPTNSIWVLSSSKAVNPVVNSSIIIDDIAMVFNPSGIEQVANSNEINLINNPASEKMYFRNRGNHSYQVELKSVTGNTVLKTNTGTDNAVSIGAVADGIYFYIITDLHNNFISSGKVLVKN
ncbi:MAG: hypothetical protein JSS90_04935 [Bacteroidetes bacterium]|jgi:hypothetical protein|nr:hypothetical protein [Bacteroidota bacterium]